MINNWFFGGMVFDLLMPGDKPEAESQSKKELGNGWKIRMQC